MELNFHKIKFNCFLSIDELIVNGVHNSAKPKLKYLTYFDPSHIVPKCSRLDMYIVWDDQRKH